MYISFEKKNFTKGVWNLFWFLVWFLFYGPSTRFRSFRARSVNLVTPFLGKPPRQFPSTQCTFFHQVTDNCSSWISGRGRMAVEMFSWPSLHERMCRTWGSNSGPLACQANTLPIELPCPVSNLCQWFLLHLTSVCEFWLTDGSRSVARWWHMSPVTCPWALQPGMTQTGLLSYKD